MSLPCFLINNVGNPKADLMEHVVNKSSEGDLRAEVDLHCHILPSWDDGPRSLQESLLMARRAEQLGIRKILVTPHVGRAFGTALEKGAQDIPAATAALNLEIKNAGIVLDLVPGAEVVLTDSGLPRRASSEPWITVGGQGRYILIESPLNSWPQNADQILFDLSLRGITAIVAHPERLTDVQADLSAAEALVQKGALLQITARSILGPERKTKKCARQLLQAGLVSLIASDAHSAHHIFPPEVVSTLCDLIGKDAAMRILVRNASAVLSGEEIAAAVSPNSHLASGMHHKTKLIDWIKPRQRR